MANISLIGDNTLVSKQKIRMRMVLDRNKGVVKVELTDISDPAAPKRIISKMLKGIKDLKGYLTFSFSGMNGFTDVANGKELSVNIRKVKIIL